MNTAGTTRDRQYGKAEWCGREFSVIDTGGWVVNSDDTFESEINRQVDLAIREADVVLLVVDVNQGVTEFDTEVAHLLRQAKKPTILAVNKVDFPTLGRPTIATIFAIDLDCFIVYNYRTRSRSRRICRDICRSNAGFLLLSVRLRSHRVSRGYVL